MRLVPLSGFAILALFTLAAAPFSTAQGVYTDAQADGGAELYAATCAMCHGARLEGKTEIPALTGKFMAHWGRGPVSNLFDYVSSAMPQHAPGSLSPEDNVKIVAFLLRANGMPAGTRPLPGNMEALKTINLEPAGPAK